MKQLKFMLAAATAVGLATAAQAGYLSGSTDFESGTVASLFTYNGAAAEPNEENESAIADGAAEGVAVGNNNFTGAKTKKLKVNTGTTPILRSVNGTDQGASLVGGNIYIDTLVQFTVTPYGDTPTATAADKLLIYLKEDLSNAEMPKTNLVARAAAFTDDDELIEDEYGKGKEFVLTLPPSIIDNRVVPGTWYRLVVTAVGDITGVNDGENYFPGFQVYLGGAEEENLCLVDGPGGSLEAQENYLLSLAANLEGTAAGYATIASVGFAGEGEVDDLVISTFNPEANVVDFTFTLVDNDAGINGAVTYTCNAGSGEISGPTTIYCYENDVVTVSYECKDGFTATWSGVANNGFTVVKDQADVTLTITQNAPSTIDFTFAKGEGVDAVTYTINDNEPTAKVKAGDVIEITDVDYADLYVAGTVRKGYTKTITADEVAAGAAISVTVDAKPLTGEGAVEVPEGTTAENIGINIETTGLANASATELTDIVKWADTFKATGKTALDAINAMVFDGKEPMNDAADAFLLNCDPNDDEKLKAAKDAFKFEDFNASNVETWLQGAIETLKTAYPNGNVVPQRAEDLGKWYGDDDEKPEGFAPKFFRAKLIRK